MGLSIDTAGPYAVARLEGTFGAEDVPEFTERLHRLVASPRTKLAVVLSEVTSIDSSGLGGLIHLVTRTRLCEGRVILVAPTKFVRGLMEVTQLDKWFEICDNLEEADRRFAE